MHKEKLDKINKLIRGVKKDWDKMADYDRVCCLGATETLLNNLTTTLENEYKNRISKSK